MCGPNKTHFKVTLFFMYVFIASVFAQEKFYDRRYDYYDIDNLIQNVRLLKKYLDCFLEKGPCTPIGRVFRQLLPEAIATACKKCSPSQRRLARKTFNALRNHFPEGHDELIKKLDPKTKYYAAFQKAIAN
ncbi:ejaculatory bulb-specific protein 3-like isoform X3 [Trichoplusia ni]|uniref:Ejaculatory bulb-specific protein 3-like isoform X3 n=1 Tax=Trichoplusia ni TaxID=7111 RepID=A0A7E5VMZ8_TRINI|nr:ejaculatory bulb-specific protein 3-like isoform X3 [Trichoplusia ni]